MVSPIIAFLSHQHISNELRQIDLLSLEAVDPWEMAVKLADAALDATTVADLTNQWGTSHVWGCNPAHLSHWCLQPRVQRAFLWRSAPEVPNVQGHAQDFHGSFVGWNHYHMQPGQRGSKP